MFNNFLFRKSPHFWDMCKNIVEPDRSQMTIWLMRIACWVPKAYKHTLRICSTFFYFDNGCTSAPQCYVCTCIACRTDHSCSPAVHASLAINTKWTCRIRIFPALVVTQYVYFCAGRRVTCLRSPHPRLHRENTCRWGQRFPLLAASITGAPATCSAGMTSEYLIVFDYYSCSCFSGSCHRLQYACPMILLTHCGRVTQICVFNTVKLGTSASSA
jgi:hypothetical protein